MLLVAPGLATRNKRPLEPKASPLIENEEAGMRKRQSKRKRSRGPAHDITTLANEASDVMGRSQRHLTVYLQTFNSIFQVSPVFKPSTAPTQHFLPFCKSRSTMQLVL